MALRDSKMCLYNVQWQELRVSLLGRWTTLDGTIVSIELLNKYVHENKHDANVYATRLWRVVNLLNAVRMGYSGQGLRGSKQDKAVLQYREIITARRQQLPHNVQYVVDSDDAVRADWRLLTDAQRKAILDNLGNRKKLHADSAHRDELGHFLDLVRRVDG